MAYQVQETRLLGPVPHQRHLFAVFIVNSLLCRKIDRYFNVKMGDLICKSEMFE